MGILSDWLLYGDAYLLFDHPDVPVAHLVDLPEDQTPVARLARAEQRARTLEVTVGVLLDALRERGVADDDALKVRVAAALEHAARTAAPPQETCTRCGRVVPRSATEIRPEGVVCDACARSSDR